ncbi:MAG: hypothetical protein IH827_06605 [Myxococcales bacterium]|nr:hypothetical protein [Myxococcales bacterium]
MSEARLERVMEGETDGFEDRGAPEFLRDPIGIIRRRWRWMLLVLGAGAVATVLLFVLLKPRYLAESTVLVTSQQISEDFVRSTLPADSLERINALVGKILSRVTLVAIIEEYDLYPELRETLTMGEIAIEMREAISIVAMTGVASPSRPQSAGLYKIAFEADRPDAAAAVANDLARRFTDESIRRRSDQARSATEFLRRELKRAETELREQTGKVTELKERSRGELPSDLTANLNRLDRLQQQRQSLALQIAEAQNRVTMLSGGEAASPEDRLVALRSMLDAELAVLTERHPDVRSLRHRIKALETKIDQRAGADSDQGSSISNLGSSSRRTLKALEAQLTEAENQIRSLDRRVAHTPARQEELAALEGKESVLRETYLEFLRKVEDAKLAQQLEQAQRGERFSIVDLANPPTHPTKSRRKYLAAGLLASIACALGIGVVLETLDPVILTTRQLEQIADLPALGSVRTIT